MVIFRRTIYQICIPIALLWNFGYQFHLRSTGYIMVVLLRVVSTFRVLNHYIQVTAIPSTEYIESIRGGEYFDGVTTE